MKNLLLANMALFWLLCSCSGSNKPPATLVAINVSPPSATTYLGMTFQYKAIGVYSDGSMADVTTSATWDSSIVEVAKSSNVDGSRGIATTMNTGTSTITANLSNISGSAKLSVTMMPQTQLFTTDTDFGKKFTKVSQALALPGYGGASRVHPDLIPFPGRPGEVLMVYTPEEPASYENMCLVRSKLTDMVNWSDDLWINPVVGNDSLSWPSGHLADFCLLYIPEADQKWWTWFATEDGKQDIAYGQSASGITWSANFVDNPVMTLAGDPPGSYDYHRAPSVLWNRRTKKFEMFYDTLKSDWSVPPRLCRAESVDGKVWTNRQIIYDPLDFGETTPAFHPIVRYFDGTYWCWFPRYNEGLWLMTSPTGLPGSWTRPYPVITSAQLGDDGAYRAGVLIDPDTYKMHIMVSHVNGLHFDIAYFTSELSPAGKAILAAQHYSVTDFDFGGSIIGRLP